MIWKVGIFVVLIVIVLAGCLGLSTTEKLAMSPLYQVTTQEYQDIRGDFTVDTFLLYKDISMAGNTIATVDRWTPHTHYTAQVRYVAHGWRFMEQLILQTDNRLYTLTDKSPYREVFQDRGGVVEEVVTVDLTEEILADLRTTVILRIQYYAGPVNIPSEGLAALRIFLSTH